MIAQVNTPARTKRFLRACSGRPVLGTLLPVHLRLFGKSSGCFFAGPSLAVDANGETVLAAGSCAPEELASFLGFLGRHRLMTDGPCPAGWHTEETLTVYALAPGAQLPLPEAPQGLVLNRAAAPGPVADLLAGGQPQQREDFYAELCTKRNHGQARIWALEQGGAPVCTVQTAALHGTEAYMACGKTVEALRGRGLGGWLITAMANTLAAEGRRAVFVCRPERCHFYDRMGFARAGTLAVYTDLPAGTEKQSAGGIDNTSRP